MDINEDSCADEYFVTAVRIFDYCGVNNTATLRVDALMDKFAPFIKTNKSEYTYLKSLLDPEEINPEVTVSTLAKTLNKYSESQKTNVDLDESFNLKNGQAPHDSDSGISTDGFQLLEELQCELREKAHLAQKLRSQLDFTDRQHEEVLAAVTAERDSLRSHVNMLREEHMTLSHVRRDYEEACDRLCCSEKALEDARRDLEMSRKRTRVLSEQVAFLEMEKLNLQELLTKSKDECHHINEMYASRQSALLEENETLRTEHADVSSRLQDQEEFMQQIIKEKVMLEMELKDVFNKSNQNHMRMNQSIDVSYTEDQMLKALDSLNADSRFAQENRLLDEESFVKALKEDQGRATNMSLFDEIRLSFSNMSRHNMTELETSRISEIENKSLKTEALLMTVSTQTESIDNTSCTCSETLRSLGKPNHHIATQTELTLEDEETCNNNNIQTCMDCTKCLDCEKLRSYIKELELNQKHKNITLTEMESEMGCYEQNLEMLQSMIDEEKDDNKTLNILLDALKSKLNILEDKCLSTSDEPKTYQNSQVQTESDFVSVSTQVNEPCIDCEKRQATVQNRSLRRYFWEPLKCLFQLFAVLCFLCAICALYGVTRRQALCERQPVPWRWLDPQDILDFLLRIEYVAEVPM